MWLLENLTLSDAVKAYSAKGGELSTKFPFSLIFHFFLFQEIKAEFLPMARVVKFL